MKKALTLLIVLLLFLFITDVVFARPIDDDGPRGGNGGGGIIPSVDDPLKILPTVEKDAVNCGTIGFPESFVDVATSPPEPSLVLIVCPIVRIFNILIILAGSAFVILIFIGAYKYSLSQGDPKGLEGAKATITHALLGFLLVAGVFVLLQIIQRAFGLDLVVLKPFSALQEGIQELLNFGNGN